MRYLNSSRGPLLVTILASLIGLLAACGGDDGGTTGESTLAEATFSEPGSFDPRAQVSTSTYNMMYNMYSTLTELDDSLQVQPALAKRWETDDYKTWRFHLREDVRFQPDSCFQSDSARDFDAHDAVYTLNRALRPGGVGSFMLTDIVEGAAAVNQDSTRQASGIEALNDSTLQITLKEPYLKLPVRLAAPFFFIVSQEVVSCYGENYGQHPVGTGPFMLDNLDPGRVVTLKRYPGYWRKNNDGESLPYLERVQYRILGDPQIALSEFTSGNLDAVNVPATLASTVLEDGELNSEYDQYKKVESVALDVHYYIFKMDEPPFQNNRKVRKAINYAVDKEQITDVLLNGLGKPTVGVLPPGVYPDSQRAKVYPHDMERARQLLAEAGYPDGEGLPTLTLSIDNQATTSSVAQFVQSSLADLGIEVEINQMDFNTLLGQASQGQLPFFYMFWEGTDPNPEIFMAQFKSDEDPEEGGYNFGNYNNPRVDSRFEKAVSTLDPQQAASTWLKLDRLLVEDAPWLFLYHSRPVRLLQSDIENYPSNPMQIRRFRNTRQE
jgi:ABC-type transport system substrate-binding protein